MNAYRAIEKGVDPKTPQSTDHVKFLGPLDYTRAILGRSDLRPERLRYALRKNLYQNRTFDVTYEDETFKELDKEVGPDIDYLVAGHTHLERALERSHSGRYYFNSGTWIRLIQLTDEILDNSAQFSRVYQAFAQGSLDPLDRLNDLGAARTHSLVLLRPTVVSICQEGGQTYGELCHAQPDGLLQPVEQTRFPRI
jgi:hypothetical protein